MNTEVLKAGDTINYGKFDFHHFFNLIRSPDHLHHIRESNKPFVISTIYPDYRDFDIFGRDNTHGFCSA